MDATGSMSHLLHKAKNTVGTMFERAAEILKSNKIEPNAFEMQFSVYRNYNSFEDKILQTSPWESKPDNLRTFMDNIEPEGGWGNEAIEIGLWHANQEAASGTVNQVILIGDKPANTKNEVISKRREKGEKYWTKTKFTAPKFYETELNLLATNGIRVHTFYVDDDSKTVFTEIANKTNGRCEKLDINSSAGAEMLTNLVTEEILRSVAGDSLVEAYRTKFNKGYK